MKYRKGNARLCVSLTLAIAVMFTSLTVLSASSVNQTRRVLSSLESRRTAGETRGTSVPVLSARFLSATSPQNPSQTTDAASTLGKIAFASDRDENFEIYVMDADGGGQTRLTENPAEDVSPAWSPDGSKIAFVSFRDINAEIYVMSADGSNQTRLTNNAAADLSPVWSPDGTKIAFVSSRDGNDEIYIMNVDGSSQTNLTNNLYDDISPTFSPNGTQIAFATRRDDNSQYEIYKMNANGSAPVRLTINSADDFDPVWSPQKITFRSGRDENDEIYVMDAQDGGNQTRLTNNSAFDIDPTRSFDGAKIAFSSSRDDNFEIYLMNADGSNLTRLTNNPANDIQPSFRPQTTTTTPGASSSTIQFSSASYLVSEDTTSIVITVTRTGSTTIAATVDFGTGNGSAADRTDYTPTFGTLTFAAGETSKTFTVSINDDAYIENDKTVNLTLANATGAALGSLSAATLVITDNDTATPAANPIDSAGTFVRQQYLDFLSREPDASGQAFWMNEITKCGADPTCIYSRRVGVSAAFFIENEFQQSGSYVVRLYKAAFGAYPTYQQFIRDRARVVGGATLESDKTALANDFVTRDAFTKLYPDTLTPDQFVNKLFDMAGLTPFTTQRQQLITDMRNGKTRAQVLRDVIEITEFKNREFNPIFVLMQYFGYLRRDPDAGGFAFWLDVLNNKVPNNYRGMVCAFINSAEYQMRFSPVVTSNDRLCSSVQ